MIPYTYMAVRQIEINEIDKLVEKHPLGIFLQSSAIAKRRKEDGWIPFAVADIDKDGNCKAVAMLHAWKVFGRLDFECQMGPLIFEDTPEYRQA